MLKNRKSNLDLSGLGDLTKLEDGLPSSSGGEPVEIPLDKIIFDPNQPRKRFDQESLAELAASIKEKGVLQPISVRPADEDGNYLLNIGERRVRASKLARKKTIPAFISSKQDRVAQLIENIQREDLSPLEIGQSIVLAMSEKACTQADIVRETGKNKVWVSRHVAIGRAPENLIPYAQRFSDYTALADLLVIFDRKPEEVVTFLSELPKDAALGRRDVSALSQSLNGQAAASAVSPASIAQVEIEKPVAPAPASHQEPATPKSTAPTTPPLHQEEKIAKKSVESAPDAANKTRTTVRASGQEHENRDGDLLKFLAGLDWKAEKVDGKVKWSASFISDVNDDVKKAALASMKKL